MSVSVRVAAVDRLGFIGLRARSKAYWELTKPGITRLVLITTAAGFYLASSAGLDLILLLNALVGTGLAAAGTNALNQYWERDVDARMRRTAKRPLPTGRLAQTEALVFATAISLAGIVYLLAFVNWPTALIVAITLTTYIFFYTPLKKRSAFSTLVGAVPGALPILAGWTAAGGPLTVSAFTLFAILFLWQLPHFLALAWVYREDYRRGGLITVSAVDPDGRRTGSQVLAFTVALVVVSTLPVTFGLVSWLYLVGSLALGAPFVIVSARMALRCDAVRAGRVFLASIAYLPALLFLMVADKALL